LLKKIKDAKKLTPYKLVGRKYYNNIIIIIFSKNHFLLQKGCDNVGNPRQGGGSCTSWCANLQIEVVRHNTIPKLFYIMVKNMNGSSGASISTGNEVWIDWLVLC